MVLNMLTTTAMIRIGKTYGNLMVDVRTGSEKLKDRARRIVNIITGLDYDEADRLLRRAHWNVKAAVVMNKTGLSYPKALSRIRKAGDQLREAIGEDIEPRLRALLVSPHPGRVASTRRPRRASARRAGAAAGATPASASSPALPPSPSRHLPSRRRWPSGSPRWRAGSCPPPSTTLLWAQRRRGRRRDRRSMWRVSGFRRREMRVG